VGRRHFPGDQSGMNTEMGSIEKYWGGPGILDFRFQISDLKHTPKSQKSNVHREVYSQ
jgi:hypothetical protein